MNKKILISIIVILIPFYIISFPKKTNFIMSEEQELKPIYVNYNNTKMELDDYVFHVVAAEVPMLFQDEAIKAQILATRTYTFNKIFNNSDYIFDNNDQAFFSDEELHNRWNTDYERYANKLKSLINATKEEIITYQNEPIKAYYFSMSNGYTSNVLPVFGTEEEYLQSVSSKEEEKLPNYQVTNNYNTQEIATKLGLTIPITINNVEKDATNRVTEITINNKIFAGTEIRKILNLRSTDFTITITGATTTITTNGYGHGVGMSQYGANELAKLGYDYKSILKKYYTNTEIQKINV